MKKIYLYLLLALLPVVVTVLNAEDAQDLLVAVRKGDRSYVQKLLKAGVDVNLTDTDGTTALMHAVVEADATMMKVLIDAGASVNTANAAGSTALMYAATSLEKTKLLLEKGADPKAKAKRGVTPMSVAVLAYGSTPILKLLVAKGAEPEDRLIASAAQKGDLEAIQYLLSIGANLGEPESSSVSAALGARCEACVRLLLEKGASVATVRTNGAGVMTQTVRRAMVEMSQLMLDRGAPLDIKDREGFDLLMQAVLSMEPVAEKERMVKWLLEKGLDPNAKNARGETAYQLATRMGQPSILQILAKAGAKEVTDTYPQPTGAKDAREAVAKALPWMEMSGEAVFKNRGCISCHNNSVPAMAIALARKKGFPVNEEQATKELDMAIATEKPFFEPMRTGSGIGGGSDTVGYTLMGMAAAGYPSDALTDSHIHYLSVHQYPDGSWKTTSYRPPTEYSPFPTTAVALKAIQLYPLPGRKAEFAERFARAKKWLLTTKAISEEEKAMQLNALATVGATTVERAPFVKGFKSDQNPDGSWSQLPGMPGDAYATSEALYALHVSGGVPITDPVYQKGVQWLLSNQMADGTWFTVTRTPPGQPQFDTGFPHGRNQFISDAATSWASMVLLFTLPDAFVVRAERK